MSRKKPEVSPPTEPEFKALVELSGLSTICPDWASGSILIRDAGGKVIAYGGITREAGTKVIISIGTAAAGLKYFSPK